MWYEYDPVNVQMIARETTIERWFGWIGRTMLVQSLRAYFVWLFSETVRVMDERR